MSNGRGKQDKKSHQVYVPHKKECHRFPRQNLTSHSFSHVLKDMTAVPVKKQKASNNIVILQNRVNQGIQI